MVVPKLRFKEFESTVEVRKLGNISNIVVGFVGTVSDQYCDQNEGIPFVRTQNVRDGYFSVENLEYVTRDFHKKNKKSQIFNGDVLIARVGANMGMVCAVENLDTEANCANVIIIKNNAQLNSQYLSLFLNSENGQKQIHSGGAGGAQAVFNTTLAKEISFPYFPLEEQTKIASFLSAVDEKISQLTQKHELLSQYKQGMMQKLFSQQIRFKADDGSEFGEWNKFLLGDCVDILTNGLSLDQNMNGNGFKVTRIETISNFNIDLSRVGYVDTQSDISSYRLVVGDILFSNINSIAHIGKVVYIDKDYDIYHGMNLLRIQFKKNLDKKFMFYELSQKTFKQHFESIANKAVNQASINQTALKKTELCAPCLEEQIKIANFLSAIDQKIEVVAEQIEQAKTWKKGLLQQMFI